MIFTLVCNTSENTDWEKWITSQKLQIDTTWYTGIRYGKITTCLETEYLYGVKRIGKQSTTCTPNESQKPIILIMTKLKCIFTHLYTK